MSPLWIIYALEMANGDHSRPANIVLKDGTAVIAQYPLPAGGGLCIKLPPLRAQGQLTILNDSNAEMADVFFWVQPPDASYCTPWTDKRRAHTRLIDRSLSGTLAPPHEPITPLPPGQWP